MGWLVVVSLTALAILAAVALALETRPRGRAELGIAASLWFAALLGGPVVALGYAGGLWRTALGLTSLTLSAAVLGALARRRGRDALVASCRGAIRDLARLPLDAFREAWQARSLVVGGLLVAAAFLAASFVLTYLIEFCRWDDEIYHAPTVGWAIQWHGFAFVDGPPPVVGGNNGYPKLAESLSLWFVVFTDKTLMELPATLFAPPLMLATYALAARFVDRVAAVGFAVVLLLVPHSWRQFCSTYNDMEMAFFLIAATYYASRADHRPADTSMCTVALALAASTKTTWLVFVPPLAAVAYVPTFRRSTCNGRASTRPATTGGTIPPSPKASTFPAAACATSCVTGTGWPSCGSPVRWAPLRCSSGRRCSHATRRGER